MSTEPHWLIVSIIGAMIGFILPYAKKAIVVLLRYFTDYHIEGAWYEYHWSLIDNNPELKREHWKVKKGIFERLKVVAKSIPSEKLVYKGKIYQERNHLIAIFKATTHTEEVFCRLSNPVPTNDNIITGLWLALDYNRKIISGSLVLSRDELTEEEVQKHLDKNIIVRDQAFLLQVEA